VELDDRLRRGLSGAAEAAASAREALALAGVVFSDGRWVRSALGAVPAPADPLTEPWVFSLGALARLHTRIPEIGAKLLDHFDGVGAVRFGPEGVGFDDARVGWPDVRRIHTRSALAMLGVDALDREVDRIRGFFPPVPGRRRLVAKAAELLLAVVLVAVEDAGEEALEDITVPSHVVHRGLFGREKVLPVGLFAAAVLTHRADVRAALTAEAAAHGVPVSPHPAVPDPGSASAEDPSATAVRLGILRDRVDAISRSLADADADADAG